MQDHALGSESGYEIPFVNRDASLYACCVRVSVVAPDFRVVEGIVCFLPGIAWSVAAPSGFCVLPFLLLRSLAVLTGRR
jgi:hypothetical protein